MQTATLESFFYSLRDGLVATHSTELEEHLHESDNQVFADFAAQHHLHLVVQHVAVGGAGHSEQLELVLFGERGIPQLVFEEPDEELPVGKVLLESLLIDDVHHATEQPEMSVIGDIKHHIPAGGKCFEAVNQMLQALHVHVLRQAELLDDARPLPQADLVTFTRSLGQVH